MSPERGVHLRDAVNLVAGEEAKEAIRRSQEQAVTWRHHEISRALNEWAERFTNRFLLPVLEPGKDGCAGRKALSAGGSASQHE